MIVIEGLTKRFGATVALDAMDLKVEPGRIVGLIGPNGAGKTTAMSVLATLLTPDAGSARVDGCDVLADPARVKGMIGYMPDFFGVYDGLKAWEYLDFFAAAYYIPESRRTALIKDLLELVNLGDKAETYVDLLSRGMKQRLALARCLVHDPAVLIMDEPASGLDPRARAELKEIIRHLRDMSKTVLISSHILPELAEICDEVAIMEKGKVLVCGPVEEITATGRGLRVISLRLAGTPDLSGLGDYLNKRHNISEVSKEESNLKFFFDGDDAAQAALLRELADQGWPVAEFKEVRRNLEETFMAVTGEEDLHES